MILYSFFIPTILSPFIFHQNLYPHVFVFQTSRIRHTQKTLHILNVVRAPQYLQMAFLIWNISEDIFKTEQIQSETLLEERKSQIWNHQFEQFQLVNNFTMLLIDIKLFSSGIQIGIIKNKMASSDDQNVLTHTKKLGNSQFQVFCKSHAETAHLIFSIQKYLRKTPSFYYSSILTINKGRSIENIQKRLKQEFNLLTHEKSFYHIISRSMSSRQKCIQKIRRELTKAERVLTMFKKQYIHDDDYKNLAYMEYVQQQGYSQLQVDETIQNTISIISNIFVDISRLRDMTIYVVETVHKWKVQIEEWADKCSQYEPVFFIHQEQNVYDIILEDTSFIWQSTLGQYIYIVYKNDPFLVRNVIQVQERSTKTILQKYFVQILYPKSQEIVSKSIKCLQMVTFKYEPQTQNIYREEQLLIQNYLSLHRQRQEEEGIEQISQNQHQWQDKVKKQRKDKLDSKGWIFGKNLKKPNSQRVKQIIERHQHKITFIKPFNITNFAQKNSLALAYIGRSKQRESPVPLRKVSQDKKDKQIQKIYRTQSIFRVKKSSSSNKLQSPIQKGYNSQNQVSKKLASMYQSLTKLSPIIIQDPQEHSDQTPKFKKREIHNIIQNGILTEPEPETKTFDKSSRFNPTIKLNEVRQKKNYDKFNGVTPISSESTPKLKLNSCEFNGNSELVQNSQLVGNGELIQNREAINNLQDEKKQIIVADSRQNNLLQNKSPVQKQRSLDKIQVESEQKQIDFGKFIETFRANTNKPKVVLEKQNAKTELRKKKIEENRKKLMSVRELIESNKTNNQTISPHKKSIINLQGRPTLIPNFRSIPRSNYHDPLVIGSPGIQKSFSQYKQIKASRESSAKQPFRFQDDFIILQSKSIPFDIIPIYLRHIFTQIHSTSKKFTLYSYESLLSKLQDPYTHCIVFDVLTQKRGPIGQVILSENLGMNNRKLKYSIQFINIHVFQLVVAAILRIAQELLYATPCEQVICPLMQDRLDPVSTHFVSLIQNAFKSRVSSFGALTILQKQKVYYKQSDLYERLNIFYSNNKKIQQLKMAKTMMGNYRALKFQCRCLMLSSNFRMKTKSKNVVSNYQTASIGYLYRKIMEKIVTKNHLRQMKVASVNPNQNDETASLLKHNSFLRTLITSLAGYIKEQAYTQEDYIHITRFQNMSQVLTYLDYKQYSQYFHFSFLEESRFILNHELFISEFQMEVSLQFMVRSSIDFLILYNHHNLPVKIIEPNLNTKAKALIMPTTHEQIDLILIDGSQFEQETTDKLDLFSYLYIYQLSNLKFFKELQNVKEIVIPAIHKTIHDVNSVKMFDGLFRLFPEKEFYSGTYFSCKNMWQSYFPSAVIYKPELNSIVFEYPLIVGFLHKKRNQILTAFLLKNPHE